MPRTKTSFADGPVRSGTGGRRSQAPRIGALVPALAVLLVALGACSATTAPDAAAPPATASPRGGSARPGGDGAALYAARCASCHGADLRGTDRGPSHLSKVYEPGHHSDASFRAAIANGSRQHHWDFGDMPPVAGLAPDEVDAVIAYVRAVQAEKGFEPYPPR